MHTKNGDNCGRCPGPLRPDARPDYGVRTAECFLMGAIAVVLIAFNIAVLVTR
jgi:hypothetical protein